MVSFYVKKCLVIIELTPHHVYKMGKRLQINLIENKEIDLLWIAYVMLLYPLPERSLKTNFNRKKLFCYTILDEFIVRDQKYFDFLCDIPINDHPGDIYFAKVLDIYRVKRAALITRYNGGHKFQIAMTWLKFFNKKFFFYNFFFDKAENTFPKIYEDYAKYIRRMLKKR